MFVGALSHCQPHDWEDTYRKQSFLPTSDFVTVHGQTDLSVLILGSVLTDIVLTDGLFWDAFMTVNKRLKSVEKAKASSIPIDLPERFFDASSSILPFRSYWRLASDMLTVKKHVQNRNMCPSPETPLTNRRKLDGRPKSVHG